MTKKRSSAGTPFFWLKVMGTTILVLMFIVWQHVEALRLQRQIKGMQKEADQLIYQNARLQSQINQWVSPSHLDTLARKKLGMFPIDPKQRIGLSL